MRAWFAELLRFQLARPGWVLVAAFALTVVAVGLATKLQLLTGFDALLPESKPSVLELRRVSARTTSLSTIFVVLEGEDREGLRKAGDALVPALRALGSPWVGEASDGVQEAQRFLEPRAGLYADLGKLEKLRDDVEARYAWEVGQKSGMLKGLDEEPPPISAASVKATLGLKNDPLERYPGGYYQTKDGKTLVVAIRCGVLGTDAVRAREAMAKVREVVGQVNPSQYDAAVKWGLSGDLAIGLAEYELVSRDLTEVGLVGAILILSVVLLYYLRLRTVVAMGLTISVGLAWTFGLTELVLGHLNIATGFLFTIIGGNGINSSIIFMARYLEERRASRPAVEAVSLATAHTWKATLTASAAAAASYGALMVTDFKGFREFGIIGGAGMLICWAATYLVLPPILLLMEKLLPLGGQGRLARLTQGGIPFGRPFAWVVSKAPRTIAVGGVVVAVAGAFVTVQFVRADPMEYNFDHIQSDRRAVAEVHRLIGVAIRTTGYIGLDGMAVLTDRLDQVAPFKAALEARWAAAPADQKPFEAVHTLQDFVPDGQAEKLEVLQQLKKRMLKAKAKGLVSDDDWVTINHYLPPDELKPFGLADLPDAVARPFTEADGTRGRVVYISPLGNDATADAHYLRRWADSFRRTQLPDGSVIIGSGRAVIFADMWDAILADVQPAVMFSFGATLLVIALAFRRRLPTLSVMGALVIGVAWMVGSLSLLQMKLNFLNFIALPITFGIGVDYAVNVVQRYDEKPDALEALRRTGGAVILCSLTTLLGYLALARSVNFAVRSLGLAAVLGEVACLLVAVLVLPAALLWRDQSSAR